MECSNLSALLSSKAKLETLEVLAIHTKPVALRHIAYLAELPVFSVQRALVEFLKEKLVTGKNEKRFRVFKLNEKHGEVPLIKSIFSLIRREEMKKNSQNSGGEKVEQALKFSSDFLNLFRDTHA